MDERAEGLLLRLYPFSDTSLIAHWLTPDCGRLATLAKGARRPKSPLRGKLDLYFVARISFHRSRRSELHTLREVSLLETLPALRMDYRYLQQAAYGAALVEQNTEAETPLPEAYTLLVDFLRYLPDCAPRPLAVFAFELRFLRQSGLGPDYTHGGLRAATIDLLQNIEAGDWPQLLALRPTPAQLREVDQFLLPFLRQHLERVPASRAQACV